MKKTKETSALRSVTLRLGRHHKYKDILRTVYALVQMFKEWGISQDCCGKY